MKNLLECLKIPLSEKNLQKIIYPYLCQILVSKILISRRVILIKMNEFLLQKRDLRMYLFTFYKLSSKKCDFTTDKIKHIRRNVLFNCFKENQEKQFLISSFHFLV